jgi:hypothetical protein
MANHEPQVSTAQKMWPYPNSRTLGSSPTKFFTFKITIEPDDVFGMGNLHRSINLQWYTLFGDHPKFILLLTHFNG